MAISEPVERRQGAPDDLDRLLDNDAAVEDFLKDLPLEGGMQSGNAPTTSARETRDEDQEVQVKRKRIPIPKLDEDRLLSSAGVSKLRKITKKHLKFRGKGHEFSDMSRLLDTYQLWLDDLYPRAKFRDGLKMIEKVGHSKRMQIMRKSWLDETKPFRKEPSLERLDGENQISGADQEMRDEDLFADMLREHESASIGQAQKGTSVTAPGNEVVDSNPVSKQKGRGPFDEDDDDGPDEDELDALLAEQPSQINVPSARQQPPRNDDDAPDDELDALLAEQDQSSSKNLFIPTNQPSANANNDDEYAAELEVMAEMGDW